MLKVVTGPMFSGKSGVLTNWTNRAKWGGKKIVAVKPVEDKRTENCIASRAIQDGKSVLLSTIPAFTICKQQELFNLINMNRPDVLAIDEAQLFPMWLTEVVKATLDARKDSDFLIIAAGLDRDGLRKPFGCMPELLLEADEVTKLTGVCMDCKAEGASLTRRLFRNSNQIVLGDIELYRVCCRACWRLPS
jgi:thymidine kinase